MGTGVTYSMRYHLHVCVLTGAAMQSPCSCEQREAKSLTVLPAGTPAQVAVEVVFVAASP